MTSKTIDLTWTGTQFLDQAAHTAEVLAAVAGVDVTCKDETWAKGVAGAIAGYHGLRPEVVRVGAGATQVIEVLLRSLYRGLVVDVVPNFHLPATLCAQEGWHRRAVEVRGPDELLTGLTPHLGDSGAVFCLSSPRNPLGYQFAVAEVGALAELAARRGGVVVVDEVYADFAADTALSLVESHPNLVVVRTFSKAWGLANLRIGFAASALLAGSPPGGTSWRQLPNSVSGVAQRAAGHLLAHPDRVLASIEAAKQTRDRLLKTFTGVPGLSVWPSEANYVCLETAAPLAGVLARAGYRVRRLHDLRGYPAGFPAGVRFSVPPPPHDEAVAELVLAGQEDYTRGRTR